ncbi:MAG: hypothetical protein JEZ07_02215 [Phycisphaerae bacterium]|nr:hypothetical protein [Phycisphaerae bacterium]
MKILLSLLFIFAAVNIAFASQESITVGNKIVTFDIPQAFVRVEDQNVIDLWEKSISDSEKFLVAFQLDPTKVYDSKNTDDEILPTKECDIAITCLQDLQNEMNLSDFVVFKEQYAQDRKAKFLKKGTADAFEEPVWLDKVNDPKEKKFATFLMSNFSKDTKIITAISIVLATNRPLVVTVMKSQQSPADTKHVKDVSAELMANIIKGAPSDLTEEPLVKDKRTPGLLLIVGIFVIIIFTAKVLKK